MTKHLSSKHFKLADSVRTMRAITVEFGTKFEDVLKPEYFAHVAEDLRPWDVIEVRPEDETYFAHLLVRSSGRNWAVVALLDKTDLAPGIEDVQDTPEYKVGWGGPAQKFRVIRLSDNMVVSKEHSDALSAQTWLHEHLKAVKA